MRRFLYTGLGLLPVVAGGGLTPGTPGGPVLTTPGTATWATEVTDSGLLATYTITDDTVLDWGQLDVPFGDQLVFDFVGGSGGSVANMLGPGTFHTIDGSVFSNGNVGFFASGSSLLINGSVTAASVTLATLGTTAADFVDGGDLTLTGSGLNFLSIGGDVTATNGDVRLAGGFIDIDGSAQITASGEVAIAGYSQQATFKGEGGVDSNASSGLGFVLNLGDANASTIEISAGTEISNGGRIQAGPSGNGQIFLEVGAGGQITNSGTGIIVGATTVNGPYVNEGSSFGPDDGDVATAVNSSSLKIPALNRPDGSPVSGSQIVRNDAPMTASADSTRDRPRASQDRSIAKRSLMKRASFFSMRGGSGAAAKKDR